MSNIRYIRILIVLLWVPVLVSCGESSILRNAEALLETDPATTDSILASMPAPKSRRNRALYAVLKTQAEYKQYKPLTTDSLILTATDYYGTRIRGSRNRRYHSALAWYSQGCVYSELNNDLAAIDAYLKSKDLFPDTLIRYYALTEQNLGKLYLNRMMLDQAYYQLECCRVNSLRLNDTKTANYSTFRIGLCVLYSRQYNLADSIFTMILNDGDYSISHRNNSLLQMAKVCLYGYNEKQKALSFINEYIQRNDSGVGHSVKADIYYSMQEYDSALVHYRMSMDYDIELYTKCSNADQLARLTSLSGKTAEAIQWHDLYGELRDSIVKLEDNKAIKDLQYQHREELIKLNIENRNRRYFLLSIFTSVSIVLLIIVIFSLIRIKEKKLMLEKQKRMLLREKEIRHSSILILENKVKELSKEDADARKALVNLYRYRLEICRKRFYATDEFKQLSKLKIQSSDMNLDQSSRNRILEELENTYCEVISDIIREQPDAKELEIQTLLLRHLDFSVIFISNFFSLTVSAIKKRLSRLTERLPKDFKAIFEN